MYKLVSPLDGSALILARALAASVSEQAKQHQLQAPLSVGIQQRRLVSHVLMTLRVTMREYFPRE
jgi:hypothetical protein